MNSNPFAGVQGSLTVHRVPPALQHCQLSNLDWTRCPDAVDPVQQFMAATLRGEAAKLPLIGSPGLGKSHIGVGLYRWGVLQWDTLDCTFVNIPSFCDEAKATYSTDADPYEPIRSARRLVVIDDVFGRELSQHELSQIVPRVIDIAYSNAAAVVVTMNYTLGEAGKYLPVHEYDRLLSGALHVVEFEGPSYRVPANQDQPSFPL